MTLSPVWSAAFIRPWNSPSSYLPFTVTAATCWIYNWKLPSVLTKTHHWLQCHTLYFIIVSTWLITWEIMSILFHSFKHVIFTRILWAFPSYYMGHSPRRMKTAALISPWGAQRAPEFTVTHGNLTPSLQLWLLLTALLVLQLSAGSLHGSCF